MKPILFSLVSLSMCLVAVCATSPSPAPSPGRVPGLTTGPALIAEVCDKANHRDLCLSSLEADPSTKTADLSGLTTIAIRLATSNGTATSAYIQNMLSDEELDPAVEQCLNDCSENYLDAVDQLDDSLAALTVRNYGDLKKWIATAGDDADWCQGCFKETVPQQEILSNRNKMFRQLCDNALTIATCLEAAKQ